MKNPSFRLCVDATGLISSDSGNQRESIGRIFLDGVQSTTWLGPLSTCERDLLRVFSAILDADRLSPRRPLGSPCEAQDLIWRREIDLEIAVEDPVRWGAVAPSVVRLLEFMTDDGWSLTFVEAQTQKTQHTQLIMPSLELRDVDEVALFSGGLDSVLGMYARSQEKKRRFVAVSACGNPVRGHAQSVALAALREEGVQVESLKFVHQIRRCRRPRSRIESSQRSRGLLFLAMGAVTASHLNKNDFAVYEPGTGCINLSLCCAQVGAQGTRALHPKTLAAFNAILRSVLDQPPKVVAPFFLSTKGDLCRTAGVNLEKFARVTNSCDEGDGHKLDAMQHCGVCTSCIFRRIAIHSAGRRDPSNYRDRFMHKHGEYELHLFDYHASDIATCSTFSDLLQIDPDVRFARHISLCCESVSEVEGEVLSMFHRYAGEIEAFLANARPQLKNMEPQRRKEDDYDLFAEVG